MWLVDQFSLLHGDCHNCAIGFGGEGVNDIFIFMTFDVLLTSDALKGTRSGQDNAEFHF